jgi:uncharacterized protein YyaL (SSP411 family)
MRWYIFFFFYSGNLISQNFYKPMKPGTNRLSEETSPYLLQHAHNPVDWYPWGEEALTRARQEDKPLLVSIGYAACHWCHVMEKESFEDEETARLMNEHFVNIKIDREERPDLDHIYMDAVQAMTGSGGWPLNVFLTPDGKPFYGGTYFPPRPAFNRPSWREILTGVSRAFRDKRKDIDEQAENLTQHIFRSNSFGQQDMAGPAIDPAGHFTKDHCREIYNNIMKPADREKGGFGNAPKFPQSFTIQYLLHYYYHTKTAEALDQACLSLDSMIHGGIYDQLGGGFARYSTDAEWLVPHFEKMLYDNALLVTVMAEAWQATGRPVYKRAIEQTLRFVQEEMTSPEGGFYSALDADSEGEEGKFYVWSKAEVEAVLGDEAALFCDFYGVTENGNWEQKNILHVPVPPEKYSAEKNISTEELFTRLDASRAKLLQYRNRRPRPLLDDKILLGWNALMITACCKAYAALGNSAYAAMAIRNMDFIRKHLQSAEKEFFHVYKESAKYPAFLDDYAYLIQALIHLQEITGDTGYLDEAYGLTEWLIGNFSEEGTGYFYFTHRDQQDVIVRKKEIYDGAVPSGNSVMAFNLYYLGVVFDKEEWRERSVRMCALLSQVVNKYPTSFGVWATMSLGLSYSIPEIVIVGENFESVRRDFLRTFIPLRIFQSSALENARYPLLARKPYSLETQIFLCKNYACQEPVSTVNDLVRLMISV